MAYRNGTYVAFHAGGTSDPTASDIKYYNIMRAWDASKNVEFTFANSHEKASAVRDTSERRTLERSLKERLRNSKNMVLIVTAITKRDTDWVPFEIQQAIDQYQLPLIAAYPGYSAVMAPQQLSGLWPAALAARIRAGAAKVIHIPFAQAPLLDAIGQFTVHENRLTNGMNYYSMEAHRAFGLLQPVQMPSYSPGFGSLISGLFGPHSGK